MRRRDLLRFGVGAFAAGSFTPAFDGQARSETKPSPAHPGVPVVDTHTHFYDPSRPEGVPWPGKDDAVLYRPVLPPEFLKLTAPFGVVGTVVVEASPRFEDNAWLLELAARHRELFGIVGNLAPGEESFAARLQGLAGNPRYRGFRVNHDRVRKGLDDRAFLKDMALVAELGLVLDVNGGPDMPADVARLAEKLPKLKIAVNHLANLRHDGKTVPENWRGEWRRARSATGWRSRSRRWSRRSSGSPRGPSPTARSITVRRSTPSGSCSAKIGSCTAATGRCPPVMPPTKPSRRLPRSTSPLGGG